MSFIGIKCNSCGKEMPERLLKPIIVNLGPFKIKGDKVRHISVPLRVSGSDWQLVKVKNEDLIGRKLPDTFVENQVVKPEDFDICKKCTLEYVKQALMTFVNNEKKTDNA